jgi:hypothetical protein
MTLIHHPGSDHQMAAISLDAGYARDVMLMLGDACAVIGDLAAGAAPAAPPPGCATRTAPTRCPAWPRPSTRSSPGCTTPAATPSAASPCRLPAPD